METLVSGEYEDGHYHDASKHGLAWASLNELLHVIVFVYTLYGMIQFRVKFIRMIKLVKWISRLIIAHNFYLSIKFALLAFLMYVYNVELKSYGIELSAFNCSLANFEQVVLATDLHQLHSSNQSARARSRISAHYLPQLNQLIHHFGGPFKLLGNRATLMCGFYSIAIFIMLAIFPLELAYLIDVGFNFIRFVLSDPACMKDLYDRRRRHLCRLSSWSRNQASSLLTQGAKMILNRRHLRSGETSQLDQVASCPARHKRCGFYQRGSRCARNARAAYTKLTMINALGWTARPRARHYSRSFSSSLESLDLSFLSGGDFMPHGWRSLAQMESLAKNIDPKHYRISKLVSIEQRFVSNVRQLRSRLAINHQDRPSYAVSIANRNLEKFKPFVRSDVWFKASMIIYPIFIFYYFITVIFVIGLIQLYLESSLSEVEAICAQQVELHNTTTTASNESTSGSAPKKASFEVEWSSIDKLMHCESIYIAFTLSCASSFYCSYYFGTIIELSIWMREISQQIELCIHVIELKDVLTHPSDFNSLQSLRLSRLQLEGPGDARHQPSALDKYINDFGGISHLYPQSTQRLTNSISAIRSLVGDVFLRLKVWKLLTVPKLLLLATLGDEQEAHEQPGQSRAKLRELMAIKLLTKKETLMRATYVNMCLFFDELYETRFMTSTILRRTIQLASAFAFMASITHSQFKANYWHLTYLLLSVFIICNLYLACAAYINSGVNKMVVHIHALISASLKSGCESADLFEFWLRHVGSFGEDKDVTAYTIYGYKITWSTILNIDSFIFTAYFLIE